MITICDHLPKLKFTPEKLHVFTEHGAIMAASVLMSPRAVKVSVYVVRVFIGLRKLLLKNRDLSEKMSRLEGHIQKHDVAIQSLGKFGVSSHPLRQYLVTPRIRIINHAFGLRNPPLTLHSETKVGDVKKIV